MGNNILEVVRNLVFGTLDNKSSSTENEEQHIARV